MIVVVERRGRRGRRTLTMMLLLLLLLLLLLVRGRRTLTSVHVCCNWLWVVAELMASVFKFVEDVRLRMSKPGPVTMLLQRSRVLPLFQLHFDEETQRTARTRVEPARKLRSFLLEQVLPTIIFAATTRTAWRVARRVMLDGLTVHMHAHYTRRCRSQCVF